MMQYNNSKDDYKESWLATRLELIEAHDKLAETIDELEESEGIIKMLRRHRDEAEMAMDQVANFLWKCLPDSRDVTETQPLDLADVALKISVYIKKLESRSD